MPQTGAQIFGAAGNGRRGDRALGNQPALAIEIAQHQFQQLRALHDAGGQLLPIGLVDQQRQMAQRPQPVGGFAGRAIGHAGFPQMPVGGAETPLDIGRASGLRRHRRTGSRPRAARRPARYIHREFPAGGHSRASTAPRAGWPGGPCFPDCLSGCFLAGLSRHPDSPASSLYFNAGAASSSRGSKGIQLCVPRAADRSCRACGRDPETGRAAAPRPRRN